MAVYLNVTPALAIASIQFFSWLVMPKLTIGTPMTMTSAAFTSSISAWSSATRACCSAERASAGVNSAPRAASSSAGCGCAVRSRSVSVAPGVAARNRSTSSLARRVDCEPWPLAQERALELICRMFMRGSFGCRGVDQSNGGFRLMSLY